jgi:hypothetical protein
MKNEKNEIEPEPELKHIPDSTIGDGLHGPTLCGKWAYFGAWDHNAIRGLAKKAPELYCRQCRSVMHFGC